jgi:hypothetical protein
MLDALSEGELRATLSTRGGRDVARQFAHVHEVRAGHAEVVSKTVRNKKPPHFFLLSVISSRMNLIIVVASCSR